MFNHAVKFFEDVNGQKWKETKIRTKTHNKCFQKSEKNLNDTMEVGENNQNCSIMHRDIPPQQSE